MESCEEDSRDGYHGAIKDDEFFLVLHDLVPPAGTELGDTVDAAGEDGDVCDDETGKEKLETTGCKKASAAGCKATSSADRIVGDKSAEAEESDDLPHDTSDHEICAGFLIARAWSRARGQASTGALEHEREEVAADEDPGVELGSEAGGVGAELDDDVFEGEVDAGGDEGGGDDQAADLGFETGGGPRIVVQEDSADVACGVVLESCVRGFKGGLERRCTDSFRERSKC